MARTRGPLRGAALLGALAFGAALAAQSPEPRDAQETFRAGTTLVPVDVRVVDRDGNPVTDLQPSDFTVLENDVPQPIAHFAPQAFVPEPPPARSSGPRLATGAFELAPSRQRTFLIVLGRGRLQPPSKGVDAMLHLVRERLLPQDQVAVLAWNRATPFTTSHDAVLEVLERFKEAHEGIEMRIVLWERSIQAFLNAANLPDDIQRDIDDVFGGPRAVRPLPVSLDDYLDRTAVFHDITALYLGVEYLRYLAGEKHLVFVSEFGVGLRGVDGDRSLGRRAADARVALNVIHAGGVPFGWSGLSPEPAGLGMPQAMTARNLARLTGGSFYHHRFPNASMDVDAMDTASRFQYLLGYYPSDTDWNGKYRKVVVKVNRPDVTVRHRDGYYGRQNLPALDERNLLAYSRIATAVAVRRPITDFAVDIERASVAMSGDRGEVQVDLTIDLARVTFEPLGERHVGAIEVAVFCDTDDDEAVGESWQTIELAYTAARLEEARADGLKHTVRIPVRELPENATVAVYDYGSDLVGTKRTEIRRER